MVVETSSAPNTVPKLRLLLCMNIKCTLTTEVSYSAINIVLCSSCNTSCFLCGLLHADGWSVVAIMQTDNFL